MVGRLLHHAGLVCLEHTPNPMKFLNEMCGRPDHEKPLMILPVFASVEKLDGALIEASHDLYANRL